MLLNGFMMHNVMLAVCRISLENDYSFQFSNIGSYITIQTSNLFKRSGVSVEYGMHIYIYIYIYICVCVY